MTPSTRRALWYSLVIAATLAIGWLAGAAGRFRAERGQRDAEQRLQLSEARGAILSARLSLNAQNFGAAAAAFELATMRLGQARQRFLDLRQTGRAGTVERAIGLISEARQKAIALDQAAGEIAAQALAALDEVERLRDSGTT
jgi:hypothetical protein